MFNHTRKRRRAAGIVVKLVAIAAISLGAVVAHAGIANTKHNLGSTGTTGNNKTSATAEICVFCHTPHASNTGVTAPLWNKPTNNGTYTTYSTATSSTIDGSVDNSGISLACLSCHDGSQAMDSVINSPGSGLGSGRLATSGAWAGPRQTDGALTGIANLLDGTAGLSNDHPIGIQYCGGGLTAGTSASSAASTAATACRDGDFFAPQNGVIGGVRAWWVDTTAGTGGKRDKTDMILYARVSTLLGSDSENNKYQPFVECASCHDPHSANDTFLRIPNTGSAVCLACHNK